MSLTMTSNTPSTNAELYEQSTKDSLAAMVKFNKYFGRAARGSDVTRQMRKIKRATTAMNKCFDVEQQCLAAVIDESINQCLPLDIVNMISSILVEKHMPHF
jgi:hypothetical protein